jgi:acetoin utilization deacetylase AcuC-like enzyme
MNGDGGSRMQVHWHDDALAHDTGEGLWERGADDLLAVPELHPENHERIRNMRSVLERGPLASRIDWREGRHATEEELATVHDPGYVARLREVMSSPGRLEDGNTVVSDHSWRAALAAAGTALEATDAVLAGETDVAFALVRPPGHHAQPAQADGYCFFNNAALAAERARRAGVERVAVVDWDVHHGNGTQACFYDRADVLTISLHMRTGLWGPTHPQSGSPEEVGHGAGQGFNVNVELPVGSGDQAYELAMRAVVGPVLEQFAPGLIVGAVGQDASTFDPNGRQNVSMDGFRAIGRVLGDRARELCEGRLVLVQEGGYARTYAAYCLHATLEGVLGVDTPLLDEVLAYIPDDFARARESVESVQSAVSRYWRMPLPGAAHL